MGTDAVELEQAQDCSCAVKVHSVMCTQLKTLIDKISVILPDIEAARPCRSRINSLCHLREEITNATRLLQHCQESSKFYLAITGDKMVSRFEMTRQHLEKYLSALQTMVPVVLELQISQIRDDLRHVVFMLGSFEHEAGIVLRALLFQKDEPILSSFCHSEIRILQFVASRIHLTSQKDLLIEKRAILKMLSRVGESEHKKKRVLQCLLSLLKKHDKQVLEGQEYYESFNPVLSDKKSLNVDSVDLNSRLTTHDEEVISSDKATHRTSSLGSLDSSTNSVSSCGSLAGLSLQIDMSNVSLGSEDSNSKSEDDLGSSNPPPELKFFSSRHEIEATLLSDLSQLPRESQIAAIEDVQNYLEYYNHAHLPMSLNNFVEPLVGFLKAAVDRQDASAQIAASRLFSTGVHATRSIIRCVNEDEYLLLASFLGTDMTKDVLSIFEASVQRNCGIKLAQSGALTSILKIMDTEYAEFHQTAIKILYNLSLIAENACMLRSIPLGYIPKLVPFLRDPSLSGPCMQIMEKLFHTEEARVLAVETEGCIAAFVEFLDTDNRKDQEHGVSILLNLCSQCSNCCRLVMEEGIIPSLVSIQINGNERGKVRACELLRLLRELMVEDNNEDSSYDKGMPVAPCTNSEKRTPPKQNGIFSKFSAKLMRR